MFSQKLLCLVQQFFVRIDCPQNRAGFQLIQKRPDKVWNISGDEKSTGFANYPFSGDWNKPSPALGYPAFYTTMNWVVAIPLRIESAGINEHIRRHRSIDPFLGC